MYFWKKNKTNFGRIIILGLLLVLGGVILIIWAQHAMNEIDETKSIIDKTSDFFRDDVYVEVFGGAARSEASKYDSTVIGLYYSGIVLIFLGAITSMIGLIKKLRR